jgi:ATP-dependent RNA helicase DBP3
MLRQDLANEFLRDPVRVTVGSADLTANHNVKQIVEVMDPALRERRLLDLLKQYHASRTNRILIFVLYKKEAERMEQLLQSRGWQVRGIHGDKGQVCISILLRSWLLTETRDRRTDWTRWRPSRTARCRC